ncbi:MAG: MarR family transcriptional regulator [Patescibacteria group bacterium]
MNTDIQITKQLFLATQLFEKVGDRIFATYGLTFKTHEILLLIGGGSNTTTELSKSMNLTLAGITQKTKILEKKGFISRKIGVDDLRVWHFEVTNKGAKALKNIVFPYAKATGILYSEFSQSEKKQMLVLLGRITKHLSSIPEKQLKEFIGKLANK